uniref:Uncharacterized protein n=1 Tax=Rhizophora mucronata TaxID=61149 RepID=A0A2P2QMT9_RHIMU
MCVPCSSPLSNYIQGFSLNHFPSFSILHLLHLSIYHWQQNYWIQAHNFLDSLGPILRASVLQFLPVLCLNEFGKPQGVRTKLQQ